MWKVATRTFSLLEREVQVGNLNHTEGFPSHLKVNQRSPGQLLCLKWKVVTSWEVTTFR